MSDLAPNGLEGRPSRGLDRTALREGLPLFLPAVPFGLVIGVAAMTSQMPAAGGWMTSVVIFGGASQLATVTLAGVASMWAVMLAALVINSRHLMYSAALSAAFTHQPRWFRVVGPFVLIDQVFAVMDTKRDLEPADFRRYYLTLGLFFYLSWILVVSIGMLLGPVIPTSWRLDLAPALMFTGLVVVAIDRSPALVAAAVGGTVAYLGIDLPERLGILAGAVAGVAAGGAAEAAVMRRGRS
jgi:predicted branched-subunit amino acid permease